MRRIVDYKLRDFSFFCLIVFFLDSVLHLGRHIGGGFLLRPALMLLLIISCFYFFIQSKMFFSCFYTQVLFIFNFLLIIAYVKAVIFNQNMEIANEFVLYFIYLFFFPCLVYSVNSKRTLYVLFHTVTWIGTVVSLCCFLLVVTALISPNISQLILGFMENFDLGFAVGVSNGVMRFISTAVTVQIIAYFFSLLFLFQSKNSFYIVPIIINGISIFITFTRGLWLGVFIGTIYFLIEYKFSNFRKNKKLRRIIRVSILLTIISIFALYTFNSDIIGFAIERVTGGHGTKGSDDFRKNMAKMLYDLICKHIFWGNGAGAHIDLRDGRVEMTFHDIASKIGTIGLLIFMLPFLTMFFAKKVNNKYSEFRLVQICSLSALISIVVATNTNPYFITSFGLFLYSLCMRIYSYKRFPLSGFNLGEAR